MPGFTRTTYENLIIEHSETQQRLFAQYSGSDPHFDIVIVGSGMGGGILADDLVDRLGPNRSERVLVLRRARISSLRTCTIPADFRTPTWRESTR